MYVLLVFLSSGTIELIKKKNNKQRQIKSGSILVLVSLSFLINS